MSQHPYYPVDAVIAGYEANDASLSMLLGLFGGITGLVLYLAFSMASRQGISLRSLDGFAAMWFSLCAFLHICFEGYFIYYKSELVGQQTLFAMLWKEYALSDSRYLTGDLFTICIETITVFAWGPLSLLAAASVIYRSPGRHFLQVAVCMAHLYGVLLYYATNWADFRAAGVSYSRPEALYYWVYYVGFNMPWLVVPLALLWQSWSAISRAVAFQRDAEMAAKKE